MTSYTRAPECVLHCKQGYGTSLSRRGCFLFLLGERPRIVENTVPHHVWEDLSISILFSTHKSYHGLPSTLGHGATATGGPEGPKQPLSVSSRRKRLTSAYCEMRRYEQSRRGLVLPHPTCEMMFCGGFEPVQCVCATQSLEGFDGPDPDQIARRRGTRRDTSMSAATTQHLDTTFVL